MNTITTSAGPATPSIPARRMNLVGRSPLASFFVLAFALAWLPLIATALDDFPPILLAFGPSLPAVSVAALAAGRAGLRDLLRRSTPGRVRPGWHPIGREEFSINHAN